MEGVRKLLNDEQLIALGCVTAESAQLESTLTWILAAVLGNERKDQFKKLLKGGFAEKLDALKAAGLAHIPPGQDNDDFETLTTDIGALYEQRNTAVHGIWIPRGGYELPEIGEVMTERYKLGEAEALKISKKGQQSNIDVDDLRRLASNLHYAAADLNEAWGKNWNDPLERTDMEAYRSP